VALTGHKGCLDLHGPLKVAQEKGDLPYHWGEFARQNEMAKRTPCSACDLMDTWGLGLACFRIACTTPSLDRLTLSFICSTTHYCFCKEVLVSFEL
jgi:hypothetical protein